MEKHLSVHIRDATRLALRNPGRRRPALALARKILSPRADRFPAGERATRRRRTGDLRSSFKRRPAFLGRAVRLRINASVQSPHVYRPDDRPDYGAVS